MRILPDSPNLDFLRREAKELLGALRENDPTSRLSDAQRQIAEQYGFHTWPELGAEVERRRSDPPTSDQALATTLAGAFGLGEVIEPMTPIAYAIMGRRWSLRTEHGHWLATPVFNWIDEDQAERADDLRGRARAAGVMAPTAVRSRDHTLLFQVEGQRWRVDRWMDLGREVLQPVRSSVARAVGRTLATLHSVGPATDHRLAPGQSGHLTHRHSDDDWDQLILRTAAAKKPWLDDLINLVRNVLRPLQSIDFRPESSLIICINDLSVGTVRMGADDQLVLTHWDFAGPNHPAWELGYVLVHWAVHAPTNPGTARALVDGYQDQRVLPTLDLSSFWPAITANLNWIYNQFCFGLDAPDEQQSYAEGEIRSLIAAPLSVRKLENIIAELRR
ncbi:MAG TPA: phosphotransferase [Microlunatus sp.]